jgi:Secretion system C-terminal sorting domain
MVKISCIALQCPLTGGDAVYQARALVAHRTDLDFDSVVCIEGESTERAAVQQAALLSPNPAATSILVAQDYVGAQVTITDQYGTVRYSQKAAPVTIDVSGLPSGQYYVQFVRANERPRTEKILIVRP